MAMQYSHIFPGDPIADPASIIQGPNYRFTFLTTGLVRYEWAEDGIFEDRASTFVINRKTPVPKYRIAVDSETLLEVVTDRMTLVYNKKEFETSGLSAHIGRGGTLSGTGVWRYNAAKEHRLEMPNLGGTARTLDEVDGRTDIGDGVASKDGFASIDDSYTTLFTSDGWYAPRRPSPTRVDGYLFMYGLDHKEAVKSLYLISGNQPLLPRWALGNWWSRYYPYTQSEYLSLMDKFKSKGVPLSVAVIDMDWHRVKDVPEKYGNGWTGYSWDKTLFPDHKKFLEGIREKDLKITLNVHPADGVRGFEDAYKKMAKTLKFDTSNDDPIPFDCTSQPFMQAYFDMHHDLEDEGVDFWWLDWQQGPYSRMTGVDPLWILNHYHYLDSGRGGRRPVTFSRYAGPGSQRYPVGFSGDTLVTWASLDFQPEFTNSASNIGYGHWSHDIGGHMHGSKDDELASRWLQFGVWQPILRLHSSMNVFNSKEPWRFSDEAQAVMIDALRFRHRLIPYLYTMNILSARDGEPLAQPMYWGHSRDRRAYKVPNQFMFGTELMVIPITSPRDAETRLGFAKGWFPPGRWVDVKNGTVYEGDREMRVYRTLQDYPVFAKEGAIIPLDGREITDNGGGDPAEMEVWVVVGKDGEFEMLEDDGKGSTIRDVQIDSTKIVWKQDEGRLSIKGGRKGTERSWKIRFISADLGEKIDISIGGKTTDGKVDKVSNGVLVRIGKVSSGTEAIITTTSSPKLIKADPSVRIWEILDSAHYEFDQKQAMWEAAISKDDLNVRISRIRAIDGPRVLFDAIMEQLLA